MERYGYAIKSVSTYNAERKEAQGTVKFPLVSSSSNSEGYVTGKKPIQITGRPYDDEDHDDYKKHGFPTEAYPMKADDVRHRQESPVPGSPPKIDEFLAKVQNDASGLQRSSLLAKPDSHHSAQPNPYNSANGSADYGRDKERRRLFGGTNRNSSYDDPDGYGCDYNNKEGCKPSHSPIRNEKYDDYDGADYGYGGYGNYNKEGYRPISSPVQSDKYDGANKGYGSNNKERHKPISSDQNDKYDGANRGYGGYGNNNNKEGYKPPSSPTRNGKYDGYGGANKGYGGYDAYDNSNNKGGYKPTIDPPRNDNYGRLGGAMDPNRIFPGGLNTPKLGTTGTTAAPRKGTQLSEATNDIDKIIGLLEEAAINDHGRRKTTETALPYDDRDNYPRKHDAVDRSAPRNNWAASQGNDSRLGEVRGKFDDNMDPVKEAERRKGTVASPAQSQLLLPKLGTPNKNDFDRRDATSGHTNFPPRSTTHVIDGRVDNYNNNIYRRPIIDNRLAEKKLGGTSI